MKKEKPLTEEQREYYRELGRKIGNRYLDGNFSYSENTKSNNQILYDYGYKAGNKKTISEFGIWLLIGFVLGIIAVKICISL